MADIPWFFTRENPLFATYAFYTGILCLKMFAVMFLTVRQRHKNQVFQNPEDAKLCGTTVKFGNTDVERIRGAHLNDLENIPAFVFVSFLYILTAPEQALAVNLFRVFTAARVAHTFVYAVRPVPQPARGLCFATGLGVTGYMLLKVIQHFCTCSSV